MRPPKLHNPTARSRCPISNGLEFVGDRWTLLLIRDIGLLGKHRNKDLQDADEGIPSNILASRLKTMLANGLLRRQIYQEHPPRYEYHLTAAGESLLPVAMALASWAAEHVEDVSIPDGIGPA